MMCDATVGPWTELKGSRAFPGCVKSQSLELVLSPSWSRARLWSVVKALTCRGEGVGVNGASTSFCSKTRLYLTVEFRLLQRLLVSIDIASNDQVLFPLGASLLFTPSAPSHRCGLGHLPLLFNLYLCLQFLSVTGSGREA